MSNKLYAERDIEGLDEDGNFYFKHVMAMTSENLNGKSAIAAELGYRDSKIVELQARLEHATNQRDAALAQNAELVAQVGVLKKEIEVSADAIFARMPQDEIHSIACSMLEAANSIPTQFLRDIQAEAVKSVSLDAYDAGYLNDFGGGNVGWWQDYMRSELGAAHDFYQSQIDQYAHSIRQEK